MALTQKRAAWLIAAIGLVYFLVFAVPNARGAQTETMLQKTSQDETVTYPYVVRMLSPAKDAKDLFERWVLYGDYHYGYPFYFFSALAVLPMRLIYGGLFTDHTALNLWLLRQLISVLPMILAVVWMVYTQTRFERPWTAVGLVVILLSVPAVALTNIQWWHPDALSILAVVGVFFFLTRDRLRFGRDFFFAAAACGLAAGIKLAGFFFAPAILGYLLAGWARRVLSFKKTVLYGVLFAAVMAAALVVSNPFLYNAGARQEMIHVQTYKTTELDQGYTGRDDPLYYSKGPAWWEWTLTTWYGDPLFLGFLLVSLGVGCIWGPNKLLNRLILLWIIPFSIYLLYFVAVKPNHYWLPVMIPLYSAALNVPLALRGLSRRGLKTALTVGVAVLMAGYVVYNVARPFSGDYVRYVEGLNVESGAQP